MRPAFIGATDAVCRRSPRRLPIDMVMRARRYAKVPTARRPHLLDDREQVFELRRRRLRRPYKHFSFRYPSSLDRADSGQVRLVRVTVAPDSKASAVAAY